MPMILNSQRNIKKGILESIAHVAPFWLSYGIGLACFEYELLFGNGFINYLRYKKYCKFLERSQWWGKEALEQYRDEQLSKLITHAYENVPYYTALLNSRNLRPSDFKTAEDLKKLPILTKEILRKNFNIFVSKKFPIELLNKSEYLGHTSGSTGTPLFFLKDRNMPFRDFAFFAWINSMAGLKISSKCIKIWSRPFLKDNRKSIYIHDPWRRRLSLSSVPHQKDSLKEYIQFIRDFRPSYISGPPSFLHRLALYCHDHNYHNIHFPVFFSIFENLHSFQRNIIEAQFNCEIFNAYASEEFNLLAMECDRHEKMHIDTRKGIMEIIDEKGCVQKEGRGRIIYTGFNNFVMPLIRYDTGDIGSPSKKLCSCGRGLPLLDSLDGRTNSVLKFFDKYIYSPTLSVVLCDFKNIKECQFIQENETELKVNIARRKDFAEGDTQELVKTLKNTIDERLNINISFMDSIPRTTMGKFPFVISNIDIR